jgi:hemoglobin
MRELNSREDIQYLVEQFYTKVKSDLLLGDIFNNAENFSWETHIPVMIDFWETILLSKNSYKGNVMLKHIQLHKRTPLSKEHFEQWKRLFFEALDLHFEGENVREAKNKVETIAPLMLYKLEQSTKW